MTNTNPQPLRWDVQLQMDWLRANGVTEDAHQIVDNIEVHNGFIRYEVIEAPGAGRHTKFVPHRVPFEMIRREHQPHLWERHAEQLLTGQEA